LRVSINANQSTLIAQPLQDFCAMPPPTKSSVYVATVRLDVETVHHRLEQNRNVLPGFACYSFAHWSDALVASIGA
jgi:hypothetical protein